jgi:hypothetical protein
MMNMASQKDGRVANGISITGNVDDWCGEISRGGISVGTHILSVGAGGWTKLVAMEPAEQRSSWRVDTDEHKLGSKSDGRAKTDGAFELWGIG